MKPLSLAVIAIAILLTACGGDIQDADKDGVADFADWCSTVVEEPNGHMDEDGCPDDVPVAPPEPLSLHIAGRWQGTLTVQRPNREPYVRTGVVMGVSNVRDHDALVDLSCIWNGQSVHTYGIGSDRSMTVEQPDACPLDGPPTCLSRIEYGTGTLSVDADRRMTLQMDGVYEDCTGRSAATFSMQDIVPLN